MAGTPRMAWISDFVSVSGFFFFPESLSFSHQKGILINIHIPFNMRLSLRVTN